MKNEELAKVNYRKAFQDFNKLKDHQDGFQVKLCDNRMEFIFPENKWRRTPRQRQKGVFPLGYCDEGFDRNMGLALEMCRQYRKHFLEAQKLQQTDFINNQPPEKYDRQEKP